MTVQELLQQYKDNEHTMTERDKAVLERRMWASTTREVRQANRRDKWLQSIIGGETGYVFIKRAELLNAEPDSHVLWDRIHAKTMTSSKAIEILRAARLSNITEEVPVSDSISQLLSEYDNLPHTMELDNGFTIKRPSPNFDKKYKNKRAVKPKTEYGKKQQEAKEFYSQLQKDCAAFITEKLGSTVDVLTQERLTAGFLVDLKSLIDEWRDRVNNAQKRANQEILTSTDRRDVIKACRVLNMDPPKPGEKIDMAEAKKKKKTLVRVYHPDKVGNDSTAEEYQKVIEAYNTLDMISERENSNGA